jgi:hypothetical protein
MVSYVCKLCPGACLVGSFHGHQTSDGLRLAPLHVQHRDHACHFTMLGYRHLLVQCTINRCMCMPVFGVLASEALKMLNTCALIM